ncbi:hypothetical protein ACFQ6S_42120 [Streptomyces sp. NPDC056479]|uniref:hypothetical protein n=1 Tax=Streptomyces sp. NPDC056479 TaxID=3345832 RepID=UPI00367D2198
MARIRIPGDELAEVIELLKGIRDRIERTAGLESVGTEDDVGDPGLRDAVHGFDNAWKAGQERVRENAETFTKAVEGILSSFESTDSQVVAELDPAPGTQ